MHAETGFRDHGTDFGPNAPTILLLHGLMGRGRTWRRQIPWLRRYGRVFTFDAAFHTGYGTVDVDEVAADEVTTERFVADVAELLVWIDRGPAILFGHSMGGLHAWCTAAAYPELVAALIVEDMAPDFRGQTTRAWEPWFQQWPERFSDRSEIDAMFGAVAGRYFFESFDEGRRHGDLEVWTAIAQEWGTRDFWTPWRALTVPTLLVEAEFGVTPPGQMQQMASAHPNATHIVVDGSGHLAHDDRPDVVRGAVEAFLSRLRGTGVL